MSRTLRKPIRLSKTTEISNTLRSGYPACSRASVGGGCHTTPWNRIYGMLGIAKLPMPPPPSLRPDYGCPFAEIALN
ncbi:hypothetical protein GGTG_10706 [Gaeumannomyces tritici R3-111a-1]|uniref:Uncharacterized protein n=1 Tax=Gaeumannomyces tritici (strain R3-111a-1) TaxID=644352 RepID=J3PB32_GAET3|nr:hypothetical protein GGTG_10706 [Gaeumannomyces tritici R3-111a-1]EJT71448.1 hypothetical protein GGTG_10706 [Gaeumannomyces tritici R3-111a-1]